MSTETTRETIRRAFVGWQDEGAPITDVFAPAMTWRIEGRSVVAGDYARFAEGERFRPVRLRQESRKPGTSALA